MSEKTNIKHIALNFNDELKADLFFNNILELPSIKDFTLNKNLSNKIFGINKNIKVKTYGNKNIVFEIFITEELSGFEHTCIEISNKEKFIKKCKENKIEPMLIDKGDKILLFIKDYFGNLYEIKER